MKVEDFDYTLPEALLARYPLPNRTDSRLLCIDRATSRLEDRYFSELTTLIRSGDLLVFNNTKVIRARLFGQKVTGGKVELLVERVLDDTHCLAHIRASKSPKVGTMINVDSFQFEVIGRHEALFELMLRAGDSLWTCLEQVGHLPLPPYLNRDEEDCDQTRYQTVYAKTAGAVAAPTAGLHFDRGLLDQLAAKGVDQAYLTLHVGAGTFQPVRVEAIQDHVMHAERIDLPNDIAERINQTKARGGRVIAVGTTTVRALESATNEQGVIQGFQGDSQIFIYPGYQFRCVDAMITNFHLPRSTLLMLVSAFMGYDNMMVAYQHAIELQYRFYSYGDAMFITGTINE